MSRVSRIFPEQTINGVHRRWPVASGSVISSDKISVAVIFKNDAGYLRLHTEESSDHITIKAYPTKTMLKRFPPDVTFTLDMTPQEFESQGLNLEKVTTDCEGLEPDKFNKIIHMMRIFSDNISNPGYNYARRTSIMH